MQQLRGHRPRRDGAGPEDPRHRARGGRRPDRALRPDHPVAGRDGQRRHRDAAAGYDDPAAGRAGPPPAVPTPRSRSTPGTTGRSCGSRTPHARCRSPPLCSATPSDRACSPTSRRTSTRSGPGTPRATTGRLVPIADARANRPSIDWAEPVAAAPARPGIHVFDDYDLAELRDYIDWQPFFNAWEMKGHFPDILNNPTTGETARRLYDDAQEMLDRLVAERWIRAAGRRRVLPGARSGRRHRHLHRRDAERGAGHHPHAAPAGRAPRRRAQQGAGRLRRTPGQRRSRPRRRLRRHRRAWACGRRCSSSRRRSTTTPRSCSSRWPTGWPRPSPSGSTSGCAPSSGATPPTSG